MSQDTMSQIDSIRTTFYEQCIEPCKTIAVLIAPFETGTPKNTLTQREEKFLQAPLDILESKYIPADFLIRLVQNLDLGIPGKDEALEKLQTELPSAMIALFETVKETAALLKQAGVYSAYDRTKRYDFSLLGAAFVVAHDPALHQSALKSFENLSKYITFALINKELHDAADSPIKFHETHMAKRNKNRRAQGFYAA